MTHQQAVELVSTHVHHNQIKAERILELMASWLNGNRDTVYQEIGTKKDLAELTISFIENCSLEETREFLLYISNRN